MKREEKVLTKPGSRPPPPRPIPPRKREPRAPIRTLKSVRGRPGVDVLERAFDERCRCGVVECGCEERLDSGSLEDWFGDVMSGCEGRGQEVI